MNFQICYKLVDIKLVAGNQPWWGYLEHRNWPAQQIRASWTQGCVLLNIYHHATGTWPKMVFHRICPVTFIILYVYTLLVNCTSDLCEIWIFVLAPF